MAVNDLIAGGTAADARPAARPRRGHCETLPPIRDADAFGAVFERFADAKVVLLGEASHGTSEFYRARAGITRRLIERHGFTIVAVEADWPDAAAIDRYVRHKPPRPSAEPAFRRFPTWMWRNIEVESFIEWLRERNGAVPNPAGQAGFFGLAVRGLQRLHLGPIQRDLREHDLARPNCAQGLYLADVDV